MAVTYPFTSAARIVFMIGSPIAQARSPHLFNAAFARARQDRAMIPLDIAPGALPQFVGAVRGMANVIGFVATLPHKPALADLVDAQSDIARALGSVNVVRRDPDGRLFGDMADGAGFWDGAATAGFSPDGQAVILAGAGAAGTAIAHEFAARGGRRIALRARDRGEVERLQARLAAFAIAVDTAPVRDLSGFAMAINATPVGMAYAPGSPFDAAEIAGLPETAFVADAITDPAETPLLRTARERGLRTIDGNAMTLGQFDRLRTVLGLD